jgi:uncharacterized OB-fold protein
MEYAPYLVALVELDDGVRVLSQLVDVEPVKVDGNSGIIEYGYKFRPIIE